MIEKRISPMRRRAISDVWLIDFARTRRDLIMHDFAVIFAATVGLLDIDISDIVVRAVFAKGDQFHSSLRFRPAEGIIKLNRKNSGLRRAVAKDCKLELKHYDGTLKLRLVIDRYSVEVFVGEGEQTLTMTIPTDPAFDGISFYAEGHAVMDVEKYDLTGSGSGARK